MMATQTRIAPTMPNMASAAFQTFLPGVAALESTYLGQIMAFRSAEMWLYAMERGVKLEHDLFMSMLGYAPEEHVAPWDSMSRAGDSWLAAMDKGLAAAGE